MNILSEKLGRKTIKRLYRICSIILLGLFIAFTILYAYKAWTWLVVADLIVIVIWPIMTFIYSFTVWSWHIEDLMNEYKENNNVLSGGLAILALFAFPFIISLIFSQLEDYESIKEFFKGLSSLIIAAMPAFIGLLGVQYSVAIQERNRKEDIRLGAKPFFSVWCNRIECILEEDNHHIHKVNIMIQMKNISQNIGIPQKVISLDDESCETIFRYTPLAPSDEFCESIIISSKKPYHTKAKIAIYYSDVYKSTYKMEVEFILHDDTTLSETCIISDELIKE